MLYPMKFKKVFIEKVWGGREFETKLNMTLPENKNIGESWEISAHPNGMSIVENGPLAEKTLQEVYDEYKGKLVGEKVYNEYGKRFPLLIKYLDVNDRLSIQVHPDDEVANKKHNELGKSESWYIMEASDDAVLIMGMKPGISKEVFLEKAKNNDFSGMFEEISDVTYRIYDFDRIENGKKRELHIDDAAEVIDFGKKADIRKTEFENGETRKNIIKKKYYSIDKVKVEGNFEDINEESMIIYSILEGKGSIESSNSTLDIQKGESVLVPPHMKVTLKGDFEILRTTI